MTRRLPFVTIIVGINAPLVAAQPDVLHYPAVAHLAQPPRATHDNKGKDLAKLIKRKFFIRLEISGAVETFIIVSHRRVSRERWRRRFPATGSDEALVVQSEIVKSSGIISFLPGATVGLFLSAFCPRRFAWMANKETSV